MDQGRPDEPPPPAPAPPPHGGPWAPPDAGGSGGPHAPPPPGVHVEAEPDGPPTPPPLRARRRRWIIAGIVGGVVLVIGVPVGLAVAGWLAWDDSTTVQAPEEDATTEAPTPDAPPEGDADDPGADGGAGDDGAPDVQTLDAPDLDGLDGVDAVYGELLVDIDASEEVMMAFQTEVGETFAAAGPAPDELIETLRGIAADRREDLLEVRDRLDGPVDDDGAETVRESYVVHLDSWADYMAAVEQDPAALAGEGSDAGYTVAINATADAFSRSLEEQLPDDVDAEVERYAEGILDRGFRGSADAQV